MRKLTLELDALEVETFDTAAPAAGHGTVKGHAGSRWGDTCWNTWCPAFTCPECASPDETLNQWTCGGTCAETCADSCTCGSGGTGPDIQYPI